MLIIGIAGGSGSGKTTVVREITQQLKENVVVIPQDSYYKDLGHLSEEEKRVHNFDHPESIDFDLLRAQLKELREGKTVEQPIYSYITCGRSEETLTVKPADVIIVEGILIFTDPKLRKLMDIKIRERLDTIEQVQGNKNNIEWGSQIRSYVFMPYTLVKDTRTGYEDGNVEAVMDGRIDGFINAYLKHITKN